MKLALLGATGRTGSMLLAGALSSGHELRALVRDRARLEIPAHPALTVIEGDACVEADVGRALAGAEVVLFALGHTPTSTEDLLARAAAHVVRQAHRHGVRRVVALTSGSVLHPADEPTLWHRSLTSLFALFYRARFADARRQAQVIQRSGLEYVLVRATRLCDEPGVGRPRAAYIAGAVSSTVPRADVAEFMLAQLDSDAFVGQMPLVSRRAC